MAKNSLPQTSLTLRHAETTHLIKALEKLDDEDKKSVTHVGLAKKLVGIRDFWDNQERQRKAQQAKALVGKRTRSK
jgi:hypothetical protein